MEGNSLHTNSVPRESTDSNLTKRESTSSDKSITVAKCQRNKEVTADLIATSYANQETSEESEDEERLLVAYCRSGKLGAAYYTLQTGELHVLDEIVDRPPEHQVFLSLFRQVSPATLLLDGKTQGSFVTAAKELLLGENDDDGKCKLILISSKEYSYEACKRRVFTLSLPHEPPNCSEEDRVLFLRTVLDFSQVQSVHALGALLRYLDLNWANLVMDMHSKPQFFNLRKISLADLVMMDEETYKGLQVFSPLAHPSGFKRGVRSSGREGLSLCRLLGQCRSRLGNSRLRVLLRHPSCDLAILQRRLNVVEFFTRSQNECLMRNISSSLSYIRNVNGILSKIKSLSAKPYQWKALYNTLYHAVLISEMCEGAGSECAFLRDLASHDKRDLYEMALCMNRIIDFDLSKTEGKFTVKAGVDPELDLKKGKMAGLHGLMSEAARAELTRLPDSVSECALLYMPHLGYLLAIRAQRHDRLPGLRFMFQNNEYSHYKTKGCEELDVMIGDAYPEIVAHETRLMLQLADALPRRLRPLASLLDMCAELDCLIAMAKASRELGLVRPRLSSEKGIKVRGGWHPLYSATCDHFVPNDVMSTQETGYISVLTGPNASGKSVYLKQFGLIVYMAHIGCFVPAESADIGTVSHIFSRIRSTECVASHMSAFLIDLRQMSLVLREAGSRSLALVDEGGAGTGSSGALALLAAWLVVLSLRAPPPRAPHLLLATHCRLPRLLPPHLRINYLTMEYVIKEGVPVLLYRVKGGHATVSLGLEAARAAGLASLVARAQTVANCIQSNSLPPPNQQVLTKIKSATEKIKNDLLAEEE